MDNPITQTSIDPNQQPSEEKLQAQETYTEISNTLINRNKQNVYVVAGATGRCGRYIVKSLLHKNKKVRILIKNPNKLNIFTEEEKKNLDTITLIDLVKDKEYEKKLDSCLGDENTNFYVISALSYRFEENQSCEEGNLVTNKRLIDACVKSGKVKKFCLLSSSHVRRPFSYISLTCNLNKRYMQWYKVLVEDYLRKSNLEYLIIRPTGLVMNDKPTLFTISQGDKIEGKIHVATIGRLTVDTLLDPWIPSNTSFECLTSADQIGKNYEYVEGNFHLRKETDEERKLINHLIPCRIVAISLISVVLVSGYFIDYYTRKYLNLKIIIKYFKRLIGRGNI
jgi:hypothetical protein